MIPVENCCEFNYIGRFSEARLQGKEINGRQIFCDTAKVIKARSDKGLN